MKLKPIGSNMTELNINGISILFSYETPVAGYNSNGPFKTDQHYSKTTTRHINKYLGKDSGRLVSQEFINNLVKEL
tara:strand:+ start:10401 stop:10628 length:228 start_codon:yes stop_codon:yes gene_type:complete